jgi:hypothetical protein
MTNEMEANWAIPKLPPKFVADHLARELPSPHWDDVHGHWVGSLDEWHELLDDAHYYSDCVEWAHDRSMVGLQTSARRTYDIVVDAILGEIAKVIARDFGATK